tara:strand:- start:113 stop:298 length:186 start_codon:yes stop_codon:yes gene_type:complete
MTRLILLLHCDLIQKYWDNLIHVVLEYLDTYLIRHSLPNQLFGVGLNSDSSNEKHSLNLVG